MSRVAMKGAAAAVIAAAAWFFVSGPLRHSDPGGTMVDAR